MEALEGVISSNHRVQNLNIHSTTWKTLLEQESQSSLQSLLQLEKGCLYSFVDCSNSNLKPVQCSCCHDKSAGRGVEVVVGVADERATTPHAQRVRIISGIRGGGLDRFGKEMEKI